MITNLLIGKGVCAFLRKSAVGKAQPIQFYRRWYPKEDRHVVSELFLNPDFKWVETFDPLLCKQIKYLVHTKGELISIIIPYDPTRIFEIGAGV